MKITARAAMALLDELDRLLIHHAGTFQDPLELGPIAQAIILDLLDQSIGPAAHDDQFSL